MKKVTKKETVVWFIFLISGIGFIYLGACAELLEMILAGAFFSVGSIVSLYCLYSQGEDNDKKEHK